MAETHYIGNIPSTGASPVENDARMGIEVAQHIDDGSGIYLVSVTCSDGQRGVEIRLSAEMAMAMAHMLREGAKLCENDYQRWVDA